MKLDGFFVRLLISTKSTEAHFIISMNSHYNQTDRCVRHVAFGQTLRIPLAKIAFRSRKSNSKSKPKETKDSRQHSGGKDQTCMSLLLKTSSMKKNPVVHENLKSRFDELINQLFLKIDFDCTGFITFTKVNLCKQIPERVFYFLGGVFQRVKQLGGITLKTFNQLCQQVYIKAKLEDIQALLIGCQQPSKSSKLADSKTIKISFAKNNLVGKPERNNFGSTYQARRLFSTTKISHTPRPYQKYSLKVKTQPSDRKVSISKSDVKTRPTGNLQVPKLDLSYRETQHSEEGLSFQSDKVRALTQRLDHQLSRNNHRFLTNKFLY